MQGKDHTTKSNWCYSFRLSKEPSCVRWSAAKRRRCEGGEAPPTSRRSRQEEPPFHSHHPQCCSHTYTKKTLFKFNTVIHKEIIKQVKTQWGWIKQNAFWFWSTWQNKINRRTTSWLSYQHTKLRTTLLTWSYKRSRPNVSVSLEAAWKHHF